MPIDYKNRKVFVCRDGRDRMLLGYCPASRGIMGRGLEGTKVFRNQADPKDFLERVAGLCDGGVWVIDPWALMANLAQAG